VVRHRAPRVVLGRRLREPDVAGVAGQLAAAQRRRDGLAVADLAARGVDNVRAWWGREGQARAFIIKLAAALFCFSCCSTVLHFVSSPSTPSQDKAAGS